MNNYGGNKSSIFHFQILLQKTGISRICDDTPHAPWELADLGGCAGTHPPKGPDSFVLTYNIFET